MPDREERRRVCGLYGPRTSERHSTSTNILCWALGSEHPSTLVSVSNLRSVLSSQGKYEEAEGMHRRALVLGPGHPNTLTSVYNLAFLLHQQQQHKAASELYQREYHGYTKILGSQHPTTKSLHQPLLVHGAGNEAQVTIRPV